MSEQANAAATEETKVAAKTKKVAVKKAGKKAVKKVAGKKTVKKVATKKATQPNGDKPMTIGAYAQSLLVTEADVDKVLAAVLKKFPKASTSKASIYWYRSQMNRA